MIGKKVRLKPNCLKWCLGNLSYDSYLIHSEEGIKGYNKMTEAMLYMGIFEDEYSGQIFKISDMETYAVKFHNGHWEWFEKNQLEFYE